MCWRENVTSSNMWIFKSFILGDCWQRTRRSMQAGGVVSGGSIILVTEVRVGLVMNNR